MTFPIICVLMCIAAEIQLWLSQALSTGPGQFPHPVSKWLDVRFRISNRSSLTGQPPKRKLHTQWIVQNDVSGIIFFFGLAVDSSDYNHSNKSRLEIHNRFLVSYFPLFNMIINEGKLTKNDDFIFFLL